MDEDNWQRLQETRINWEQCASIKKSWIETIFELPNKKSGEEQPFVDAEQFVNPGPVEQIRPDLDSNEKADFEENAAISQPLLIDQRCIEYACHLLDWVAYKIDARCRKKS